MIETQRIHAYPKAGTSGVLEVDGVQYRYHDFQLSGELLHDNPTCPEWVREDVTYWVRHTAAGAHILGPVLNEV